MNSLKKKKRKTKTAAVRVRGLTLGRNEFDTGLLGCGVGVEGLVLLLHRWGVWRGATEIEERR